MPIQIINRRLDLRPFQDYVETYDFGPRLPNKLVIHHTWRPTQETWGGEHSIKGLSRYYEGKGWSAGPHMFVADDGIWLFTPMNRDGIHAGELNKDSIGIEIVGDYDEQKWSGKTKENALGVIKILSERLGIKPEDIRFHSEVSTKSCPGRAITKDWLFKELENFRITPKLPGSSAPAAGLTSLDDEVMVPVWAAEAVGWVHRNHLFEIHDQKDVEDAVKFYRLYRLVRES